MFGIRRSAAGTALVVALGGLSVFGAASVHAQTPAVPAAAERRLSITDAVQLALEQNADLEVVRLTPQLQDLGVSAARANWAPSITSLFQGDNRNSPPNSFLSGGQTKVTNNQTQYNFGIGSALPWYGSSYRVGWDNYRSTTNNQFANFSPQTGSTLTFNFTQPLLRNFKIDGNRQQLQVSRKNREISDVQVREAVAGTTRAVKNAYWDLVFSLNSLEVQRLSLDLAQRSLKENRARVEIGTMAPIDIVEAEAEVAQREEAVIVAEAAIARAEDQLRGLVYGEHAAEQWDVPLVPTDAATFTPVAVDLQGAVQAALDSRTDIVQAEKTIEANDISIRYLRNQILPALNASVDYGATGIGGSQFIRGPGFPGDVIGSVKRPFTDVLSDIVTSDFPTWTFALQLSYPLGNSSADVSLARARLQNQQSLKQLNSSKIRVATEVRETARTVTTNAKRVDATRSSRALAEKRLEAEEKKFQAGMTTNFFVLQAQRDLNQARNNELQALIDYLKSVVNYETAQIAPLSGGAGVTVVSAPGAGGTGTTTTSSSQQRQQ
ncbi:MAG TPA: TolC family protein [Vicinamibacterales bacterium]|nr:TolC family protein [Vicinamibacterales bacterium]